MNTITIEAYADHLRAQGFRMTPQRRAILHVLGEAGCHLSPLEVCRRAQELVPGTTEATVYRTLTFLSEQGAVLPAHVGYGQLVYEIAGHNHHHLICRLRGAAQEIEHEWLDQLYQQFQTATGYQIDSIHVTFFGLFPACQKQA